MSVETYSEFPRSSNPTLIAAIRNLRILAENCCRRFSRCGSASVSLANVARGDLGSLRNCILQLYATRVSKLPRRRAWRSRISACVRVLRGCVRSRVRAHVCKSHARRLFTIIFNAHAIIIAPPASKMTWLPRPAFAICVPLVYSRSVLNVENARLDGSRYCVNEFSASSTDAGSDGVDALARTISNTFYGTFVQVLCQVIAIRRNRGVSFFRDRRVKPLRESARSIKRQSYWANCRIE